MVWSPPSVITRGSVSPLTEGPFRSASRAGLRRRIELWPFSICWMAYLLSYLCRCSGSDADVAPETYDVTGMSPQSSTLAQLWNGFASRGTL